MTEIQFPLWAYMDNPLFSLISVLTLTFITNDQPKVHSLYEYHILPNSNYYSAYSPISKITQIFYFPPGKENDSVNTGKISIIPEIHIYHRVNIHVPNIHQGQSINQVL